MYQKQRTGRSCAAALAGLAVAAVTGACTDGGEAMFIYQNQVPTEGCVIPTGTEDTTFRASGAIETRSPLPYLFTPVIVSNLVAQDDDGNDPDRLIALRGADIDVTFANGVFSGAEEDALRDDALTRFSQAFSGTVSAGGETSVAFAILSTELLDRVEDKLASGERTQATAKVVVFGELDGGGEVESVPFYYPIDICVDCLSQNVGDCASLDAATANTGNACNPYQDEFLECCDGDGGEVCPAAP